MRTFRKLRALLCEPTWWPRKYILGFYEGDRNRRTKDDRKSATKCRVASIDPYYTLAGSNCQSQPSALMILPPGMRAPDRRNASSANRQLSG